jgi:hypothetical protein
MGNMPEPALAPPRISWPGGKRFAFTIFDDPDSQTHAGSVAVYSLLRDAGLRTTKAVWPIDRDRPRNSPGDTCANPGFLRHAQELQEAGFEIAYHNAGPFDSTREDTAAALDAFRDSFGHDPFSMANHYNAEAIYWGASRLTGVRRALYRALNPSQTAGRFSGHVPSSPYYWGDLCRERIEYCRNFVFSGINTLAACPFMPYSDPLRPYARQWFAATDGAQGPAFFAQLAPSNLDRLEEQGGACILYTHFGLGFFDGGKLDARLAASIRDVVRRDGWFVPVSTLLDYLRSQSGGHVLAARERARIEWRWLGQKIFRGTS